MGKNLKFKNYNPRIEITISDELYKNVNGTRSKLLSWHVSEFNNIVKSAVCDEFQKLGYDVSYCGICHTLKLSTEFYTDESVYCKICDDHIRQGISKNTANAVKKKTDWKCAICGGEINNIHHIIPKSDRGSDKISNLIGLCTECHKKAHNGSFGNQNGYDKELATKLLQIPTKSDYEEYLKSKQERISKRNKLKSKKMKKEVDQPNV